VFDEIAFTSTDDALEGGLGLGEEEGEFGELGLEFYAGGAGLVVGLGVDDGMLDGDDRCFLHNNKC
jgi:hypothetical protein